MKMTKQGRAPSRFARPRYYSAAAALVWLALVATYAFAAPAAVAKPVADSVLDLRSPEPEARAAAEMNLKAAGSQAVRPVVADMRDGRGERQAVALLSAMGPNAVAELVRLLGDPDVKVSAAKALSQVIGPASSDQAASLLAGMKDPAIKYYCGVALVRAMGPKAKGQIPVLLEALKSPDKDVRAYAAGALGQIGPKAKSAVVVLMEALKDPDASVRWSTAVALGKIGPNARAAVAALEAARQDPDGEVRQLAAEALGKIRGRAR